MADFSWLKDGLPGAVLGDECFRAAGSDTQAKAGQVLIPDEPLALARHLGIDDLLGQSNTVHGGTTGCQGVPVWEAPGKHQK